MQGDATVNEVVLLGGELTMFFSSVLYLSTHNRLDHEMPVMDGPTACKQMRLMGCSSFVAGVTGNLLPEDLEYFMHCGANAVLPKPFKMASLEDLWVEYGVTAQTGGYESEERKEGAYGS